MLSLITLGFISDLIRDELEQFNPSDVAAGQLNLIGVEY